MKRENVWWVYGLVIIPGALWGFAAILIEIILRDLPPFSLSALRAVLTTLTLVLVLYGIGGRLPYSRNAWINYLWIGLFNNAIPFTLMTMGQTTISAGLATILVSTMPLFTILLAHFYTSEKLTRPKIIGMIIGFGGVLVLLGPSVLLGIGQNIGGQLLIIASALAYAIGGVVARRYFEQIGDGVSEAGNSGLAFVLETSTAQYITAASCLIPLSLFFDAPWTLSLSAEGWGAMLLLGVVFTVVAAVIYFFLIEMIGAGIASTSVYLIPIFGVIGSAYWLQEQITRQAIIALALIFIGISLVNRQTQQTPP